MSDKLAQICADKRAHVARQKERVSLAELEAQARQAPAPRGFESALRAKMAQGKIGLIAEIKKASPSAGLIRPDFDPAALAKAYAQGGAACLSVLTDEPYFQGCNAYLETARKACDLPVLRKDFIVDPWQIVEARAIGADCVLLILAALEDALAQTLHATATAWGMDVLLESHNREELDRALRLPSGILGINNRNLKTLVTDLSATESLAASVPPGRLLVSESGIATHQDLQRLGKVGAHCCLVGESLMRQPDVLAATRALLGETARSLS